MASAVFFPLRRPIIKKRRYCHFLTICIQRSIILPFSSLWETQSPDRKTDRGFSLSAGRSPPRR
ncbi:MAG: hypothetical protein K2K51_07355, partial [Bacteroidales bacterium]|nr:hypothetical protein [Bacteroidales bacterium]